MGCRFCLSCVGGPSPGQLLWGGGQCSVAPTLCCGHARPFMWVFVLVPESKGKIGFKLFKKLKAPTYIQIVAFCVWVSVWNLRTSYTLWGGRNIDFLKATWSARCCTCTLNDMEPCSVARVVLPVCGWEQIALLSGHQVVSSRTDCRAVPFAETAFPSLTPGWFLITALRNNSEATGVTVSSVQFSGLVSSQSRVTITTNDCGTSSSSFRETPVACGCPCCCPCPQPRSWEHTHLSVCLDLPVLDIHTNRICDLLWPASFYFASCFPESSVS